MKTDTFEMLDNMIKEIKNSKNANVKLDVQPFKNLTMLQRFTQLLQIALIVLDKDCNILILGPGGTGKSEACKKLIDAMDGLVKAMGATGNTSKILKTNTH